MQQAIIKFAFWGLLPALFLSCSAQEQAALNQTSATLANLAEIKRALD